MEFLFNINITEQEKILHYPMEIIIFCPMYDARRGVVSIYYKNHCNEVKYLRSILISLLLYYIY
jgi:hypothetical protein